MRQVLVSELPPGVVGLAVGCWLLIVGCCWVWVVVDCNAPNRRDCDSARAGVWVWLVPTRYGRAIAQVDAFFDQTGGLWGAQKLNGKMATILTSTGTQVRMPFFSRLFTDLN